MGSTQNPCEITLYIPSIFEKSLLITSINRKNIPYSIYSSQRHHPNAILFYRHTLSGKINSQEFLVKNSKVIAILLKGDFSDEKDLIEEYI